MNKLSLVKIAARMPRVELEQSSSLYLNADTGVILHQGHPIIRSKHD